MSRYKHFLRDMTENTTPDRPEFQQLARAVKAVSGVSQHIQDRAHSHHNQLHMLRVQKTLKGRKTKVLAPGKWEMEKLIGSSLQLCLLFQLTFEREKLLLMSSDQEDINDWYRSLSSATRRCL
ncbi:UNVERIFIED_CONTAM: hypothetical protein FKN15_040843 [Acipenser sinensis]